MKNIMELLGFTLVSGIFSVMGRAIGKVIIMWFPEIGIIADSSFMVAFSNGIILGLVVGLFWIIIGARLFVAAMDPRSPDSMKPIAKLITAAYIVVALIVGVLPTFVR